MQATTQITTKEAAVDLPEGMNAALGVEYLARLEGFEGDHLPAAVILERGFSETTGFFNIEELASDDRPRVRAAAGQLLEAMK